MINIFWGDMLIILLGVLCVATITGAIMMIIGVLK